MAFRKAQLIRCEKNLKFDKEVRYELHASMVFDETGEESKT